MGTTANQKKVFFNLRKAQSKISILDDGDMRLDQVKIIARRLGVTETDVIDMNRRLGGDASLNAAIRDDGEFGVSRERVRQIEVSAFEKVQNAVKHRVAAMATPAPLQVR